MISNFNYYNCDYLIHMKPKYFKFIWICLIIFGGVVIGSNYVYVNDIYYGKSYVECNEKCLLSLTVTLDVASSFNNINYLSINGNNYYDFNYEMSDIKYDIEEQLNYQILYIYLDETNITNNTIQDIKIYFNENTLFNKVIKTLLN